MNTKLLADTIGSLDGELLDEVIEEHYKRTMPGKTIVIPRYRRAIAVAAILLTVSAAVPMIVVNNAVSTTAGTGSSISKPHDSIHLPVLTVESSYPKTGYSSFLYVRVVKVYEGVYGDDVNDTTHCILADLEVLNDIWNHGAKNKTITAQFVVDSIISKEDSTIIYDDFSLYRDFLEKNNTGLIYVFQNSVKAQKRYSFQTESYETFPNMFWGKCGLSSVQYLPVENKKLNINKLTQFLNEIYCEEKPSHAYPNDFEQVFYDGEPLEQIIKRIREFNFQ